jgi:zinc transport system substrate-binding protein
MLLASALFSSCGPQAPTPAGKLTVVASIFVLYDFAREVGGQDVVVSLFIPPGAEAHSYEPTARDIMGVRSARVFLYTGGLMEPWAERILATARHPDLLVVNAAGGIVLLNKSQEDHDPAEANSAFDPHFWLDPVRAIAAVENIRSALAQADPAHAAAYNERAKAYTEKLAALDRDFRESLAPRKQSTLIFGGHNMFGYFGARYGLEFLSPYPGFSPEAEPQARALVEMAARMKRLGLKVIYHEENVEPKVARMLAGSTGSSLALLHGVHNISKAELASGASYLSIMRANLATLKADPGLFPGAW